MLIYVKSVLVGLLALIAIPILLIGILIFGLVTYTLIHPTRGEGSTGWDLVSLARSNPIVWFVPVLIFLSGFLWEYRRLSK